MFCGWKIIFNVIYESRAINDGFYMAPESEKPVSDSNEKRVVGKSLGNDQVIDLLKQGGSKGKSSTPDLGERAASISHRSVDKKSIRVSTGSPARYHATLASRSRLANRFSVNVRLLSFCSGSRSIRRTVSYPM